MTDTRYSSTYRVKSGGLMRCCLQSLDDAMVAADTPPSEGDTLRCRWCKDEFGMVFKDGAWRWAKPDDEPLVREFAGPEPKAGRR